MESAVEERKDTSLPEKNYKGNVTLFIIGVAIAIIGFLLLMKTNKGGDNWASYISSFSIIIGYIVVALSLIMDFPPASK